MVHGVAHVYNCLILFTPCFPSPGLLYHQGGLPQCFSFTGSKRCPLLVIRRNRASVGCSFPPRDEQSGQADHKICHLVAQSRQSNLPSFLT